MALICACWHLISSRSPDAPATLCWVCGHTGNLGNEAINVTACNALSSMHMPTPDEFAWMLHYMLAGEKLDSDWNDAITAVLHHHQLSALVLTHCAREFYPHMEAPSSWHATKLNPRSTSFMSRACEHALATAQRAHLYFAPDPQLSDECCPLCLRLATDDTTH